MRELTAWIHEERGRTGRRTDFSIRRLGHRLKSLELSDLHRSGRRENVGSLSHELCGVDLRSRRDDLGFSDSLLLRSTRERLLKLETEQNVLDEDTLDRDSPSMSDLFYDPFDLGGDGFSVREERLESSRSDDISESRLRSFRQSESDVSDSERRLERVRDAVCV